jgi:hypothetical protein
MQSLFLRSRAKRDALAVKLAVATAAFAFGGMPSLACAQDVHVYDEYNKLIQQRSTIDAFGAEGFGDKISLNDGSLEIIQTDVDLRGNNAIPVTVSRRFTPADIYNVGHFGFWSLEIPNIHGVFSNAAGWTTGYSGADNFNRCSKFGAPPMVYIMGAYFEAKEYWQGSFFYLPGAGDQEMLRAGTTAHVPTDGAAYPIVTKEGAAIRCVTLSTSSEAGNQGQGFEVRTSDGMIYTMNHMVSRIKSRLTKAEPAPEFTAPATEQSAPSSQQGETTASTLGASNYVLARKEVLIYPTRITDRFGNYVDYSWNPNNPWQLLDITASDGRHVHFTYVDATGWRIATASDGAHTWYYDYVNNLTSVTRPDGSAWSFDLSSIGGAFVVPTGVTCDVMSTSGGTYTGSVTSPSGAKLDLILTRKLMGRSWVFRECVPPYGDSSEHAAEPYLFLALSVTSKKITGPGLPTAGLTWSYVYGSPNNCWDPNVYNPGTGAVLCTASSPTTRQVSVTDPDLVTTRYTYGNRYKSNEGLLIKTEFGWNGTSALRTVTTTYADPTAAPYAAYQGTSIRSNGDRDITSKVRPQRQMTTVQQGKTFTWEVAAACAGVPYCFDSYARPTKTVKSSAP